jgi:hypothetical protein
MPDIVRLRFIGPYSVAVPLLGQAVGMPLMVEPDQVVDVVGKVLADDAEADHFVLEVLNPPEERVFPRTLWALDAGAKKPVKRAPTEAEVAAVKNMDPEE